MAERTIPIPAICNGTVIDHVLPEKALDIVRLLELLHEKNVVSLGLNLSSPSMGTKAIIKVANRQLTNEEANQLAILSPQATINLVDNYEVVKKFRVHPPQLIHRFLVCPNRHCVTNHEPIDSLFHVLSQKKNLWLKCSYCEKSYHLTEITQYKL